MSVGGGGVARTRPAQDSDITKALDLIAGISRPDAIKELQAERLRMKEEADRLLKGQEANSALKEAERLKSEANAALSEATERAASLMEDASQRIQAGLRDLEVKKVDFEIWSEREKKKIQALSASLADRDTRLTEEKQQVQSLRQKARTDIEFAESLRTQFEAKLRKLKEIAA